MHALSASLPSPYELIAVDSVDSVLAEGGRRAGDGAEEGTLIWAGEQRAARTRQGHAWSAPLGNLHCALVIRPDYPRAQALELCHVAALAAGAAIAESVSPMTGMSFGWPGDLLINGLLAGMVQLDVGPKADDSWQWMVVALSLNVAHHPPNPEPERFNSIHDSGDSEDVTTADVLAHFARHFLREINAWAENGYPGVRTRWLQRAHDLVAPERMNDLLGEGDRAALELANDGALIRAPSSDSAYRLGIDDYFALSL